MINTADTIVIRVSDRVLAAIAEAIYAFGDLRTPPSSLQTPFAHPNPMSVIMHLCPLPCTVTVLLGTHGWSCHRQDRRVALR